MSMKTECNNQKELSETISQGVWLVSFSTFWSYPCRAQDDIFDIISGSIMNMGAGLIRVNPDLLPDVSEYYSVNAIPMTLLFKGGKEVKRMVGVQPAGAIYDAILQTTI